MQRINQVMAVLVLTLATVGCGKVGDAPEAKTGGAVDVTTPSTGATLAIDTAKSKVSWVGAKVTGKHDGGFRKFDGTVTVDSTMVTGVKVNIDMNSIYTDSDKLVGHLKSDDFFSTGTHPTATFEASQFVKVDTVQGATHMVTGNLTMRGKTNSVTFPATINVGNNEVTAKSDFKINRKQWDIVYPGAPDDLISDDVRIIFDIVANKGAVTASL